MENEILKKLDVLTKSVSKIDDIVKKLDEHDKRFDSIDERFDSIDERFGSIDEKFDSIDKKFEEYDLHFRYIRRKLDNIEKTVITHSENFDDLPDTIKNPIVEHFEKKYANCDQRISVLEEAFNPTN